MAVDPKAFVASEHPWEETDDRVRYHQRGKFAIRQHIVSNAEDMGGESLPNTINDRISCTECFNRQTHWLGLHQHSRPASKWRIVDCSMGIGGEVPRIAGLIP